MLPFLSPPELLLQRTLQLLRFALQAHENLWKGKRILFARKFSPEVDKKVIRRLIHGHSPHVQLPWDEGAVKEIQENDTSVTLYASAKEEMMTAPDEAEAKKHQQHQQEYEIPVLQRGNWGNE